MSIEKGTILTCSHDDCAIQLETILACECDSNCDVSCCGQSMKANEAKTADSATEKHVPVIEAVEGGYKVTVGSTLHPMEEDHYIQWIELTVGPLTQRCLLTPGGAPSATFLIAPCDCGCGCPTPTAREFCNKHGLWSA